MINLRSLLTFKDKHLEKEFKRLRRNYQIYLTNYLIVAWAVGFLIGWIINPINMPLFQGIPLFLRALTIFSLLLSRWIIKYFPMHVETVIAIIVILASIIYMESTVNNHKYWNPTMYLLAGFLIQMNMLMLMMAKISSKLSIPVIIIIMLWCLIRYIEKEENNLIYGMAIFVCLSNIILLSLLCIINELGDRQQFADVKQYEDSLIIFKNLIKEVFPSAVLIVNRSEILFCNEETLNLFTLTSEPKIFDELRKVSFEEDKFHRLMEKNHLNTEGHPFEMMIDCNNTTTTLFEFIKSANLASDGNYGEFVTYYGKYLKRDNNEYPSETTYLEIKTGKIMWEMKPAMIIILQEDLMIKKMKLLDEQAKYKDKLLATVSHDLRTPLNGVIGMLEIVLETVSDGFVKKSLVIAHRSSKMLLFMINDILDFSQISNGKLRINFVTFDVAEIVREVSKLIKFQAKRKGLKFLFENLIENNNKEDQQMVNDPNRLRQILLNLLGNALKFTHHGFIRITVEAVIKDHKRAFLFSVEDTGPGIKPEDMSRLFKLFGKLEGTQASNHMGVGLGLVISQELVKMMNENEGDGITVVSQEGLGSRFSFILISKSNDDPKDINTITSFEDILVPCEPGPIDNRLLKVTKSNRKLPSIEDRNQNRMNVLIVDDDQINILVATRYLNSVNTFSFEVAMNGAEAVKKVEEAALHGLPFDIVLMDCQMPVMDGYTACQLILNAIKEEKIPKLSIIATTASSLASDSKRCFEVGMRDILIKPYSKKDFMEKLMSTKMDN